MPDTPATDLADTDPVTDGYWGPHCRHCLGFVCRAWVGGPPFLSHNPRCAWVNARTRAGLPLEATDSGYGPFATVADHYPHKDTP